MKHLATNHLQYYNHSIQQIHQYVKYTHVLCINYANFTYERHQDSFQHKLRAITVDYKNYTNRKTLEYISFFTENNANFQSL